MSIDPIYIEKKLLTAISAGDATAFGELFRIWKDKLYFYLLRISQSPETAEDQLQDIFIKVWINRHKLGEVNDFGAWLFSIARNHALSGMRRMALETVVMRQVRQNTSTASQAVDETLLYKQIREKLKEVVDALPAQQRQVYQLSREQGLKQEEIARQLQISISTVQNHMTLALRTIRSRLLEFYPSTSVYVVLALITVMRS